MPADPVIPGSLQHPIPSRLPKWTHGKSHCCYCRRQHSDSRALLPPSSTFPPYLIASCVETRCHWPAHRISTSVSESATEIRSSACHSHLELPCEERRTEEPQTTHIMGRRCILAAGQMAMPSPSPSAMANPRGPLIPRPKSKPDLLNSSYALLASTPHCKRNNPICLISEAI